MGSAARVSARDALVDGEGLAIFYYFFSEKLNERDHLSRSCSSCEGQHAGGGGGESTRLRCWFIFQFSWQPLKCSNVQGELPLELKLVKAKQAIDLIHAKLDQAEKSFYVSDSRRLS